jgi:WD40 repeat protein
MARLSPQLARFLQDAEKFVQSYSKIIGAFPLQTYGTALVFSPIESEIRKTQWKERLPCIKMATSVRGSLLGTQQRSLKGHTDSIKGLVFSPDGKTLASTASDLTVQLWDTTTSEHQQTLGCDDALIDIVAFSPDSKILALGDMDWEIRLWDVADGKHRQMLEAHDGALTIVAFSPDNKILASGSDDGTIQLWDVATGEHQETFEVPNPPARRICFKGQCLCFKGPCLETDRGSPSLTIHSGPSSRSAEEGRVRSLQCVASKWVTKDGKRALWIPHEYRGVMAVHSHTVALGHDSGEIIFLRFSFAD